MVKKLLVAFLIIFLCGAFIYSRYHFKEKIQVKKLSPVLNVYNWEDYLAPDTIQNFENRFGVKINLETFKDEEELVSALQSNPADFDVIIVSDALKDLIEERLLAPINFKNIPNFKNIDPKFINLYYDPGNRYSVPYLWGTTGIAYNTKYVQEKVDSWSVLWNPEYKGKISMLDTPYEVIFVALKYLGYSLNTFNLSYFEEAGKKIIEQKPLLSGYEDIESIKNDLIAEKIWIAHIYSGEAMYAANENDSIRYVIPKEGASIWIDNLCIPRDARHKYTAEVFINYILEPKVSADIANYLRYANCNLAAKPYTSKEILNNPDLYPPQETLKRCEFYEKIGDPKDVTRREQMINKIWSEVKSE